MRRAILGAFGVAAISLACEDVLVPRPVGDLHNAPASVAIDGQELMLTAFLWRDFMPSSPPDRKPLVAIFRPVAAGDGTVPTSVRIDTAWVVLGNDVWTVPITEERLPSAQQAYYEAVARNGPKWGPGVTVDVIVRIRAAGGTGQLLRAPNQPIHRTD